jgi:YD repeat-containing protein
MNELLSISDGTVFTYDGMGNTLTKSTVTDNWFYTYNKGNQLTQVVKDQYLLAQYQYDGDGNRVSKIEWIESLQDYKTTIYVYSGLNVLYEKNPGTGQETIYVYGPAGRIAKKVEDLTDYYHTDRLGSTRLITDESGQVVTDVV